MKNFLKNVILDNKLINKGDRVGVAVSGGVDSMCLFYLLSALKEELGISKLVALHINHTIRGKESDEDEEFVKQMAINLGEEFWSKRVDAVGFSKLNGYTLEQGARILRYNAFNDAKEELSLNSIALAHHQGDQAETLLMHAFRGSGIMGLVGMKKKNGIFIRPMLDITRQELEEYALNNKIKWRTDSTNHDTKYARNLIRNVVIKEAEKAYPTLLTNLSKLSLRAGEVVELLDSLVPKGLVTIKKDFAFVKDDIKLLHNLVGLRAIQQAFCALEAVVDVEEVHFTLVRNLFNQKVGKKLSLPNNVQAVKEYGGVIIYKNATYEPFKERSFTLKSDFEVPMGKLVVKPIEELKPQKNKLVLDPDKVPSGAVWRQIKKGDTFTKFGGGSKSLTDYLTNKKISSYFRSKMVVLAYNQTVLCVPGVEISELVKIENNSKKAVEICLKN